MLFVYNPIVWIYLTGAVMLIFTVIYLIYKNNIDFLWIITLLLTAFWCLGYAVQISVTNPGLASFWYIFSNDFIGLKTPTILLIWALKVTGRKKMMTPFSAALLFAIPVATDVFNLTNSYHGLMYTQMGLRIVGGYPILFFTEGLWYWVITFYCMSELFAIIALLVKAAFEHKILYRRQGYINAVFVSVVFLFIVLMIVFDGALFNYYDFTPVVISAVVFCSSFVFHFKTQEPVPVPRDDVIDKMTNAVIILDNRNRIMDMNKAAETFFGFKSEKIFGMNINEALSDWPEIAGTILNESNHYCEFDKNDRYYKAYFSALSDERKSAGNIVIIQDVTDIRKVELQAMQQKQALVALQERDRLTRELHDSLGQVMGYVNMQIELIRKMLKDGDIQAIDACLNSLSEVIEEANTEVREFIYEVKTTTIFKDGFFLALNQYLLHFEQVFNIKVKMQNPDEITDKEIGLPVGVQLFRIIQEALTNVRKHSKADSVSIDFCRKDENIIVSIADNGVGFDPGRINKSSSFGLTVMKERVSHIGGQINVASAISEGTTITLVIPVLSNCEIKAEADENAIKAKKIRVLLADDHVLFIEGLKELIEQHNFEVVGSAKDGMEALEKARIYRPDMILMDLQMPRCNGITATRLIKNEIPEIKIVILSMSDREQNLFEAIKNGASGYLLKGLGSKDFIKQLSGIAANGGLISPETASQVMQEINLDDASKRSPGSILTQRQIEILSLVAKGLTYKEIATKLYISERTVKYQMSGILKNLNLQNRSEAVAYAQKMGYIIGTN